MGGFNYDSKVRRQSINPIDLLHGHIGGIDVLARSLLIAADLIQRGDIAAFGTDRYAGWDSAIGAQVLRGELDLVGLANHTLAQGSQPRAPSGRQKYLEYLVANVC